MSRPYFKIQAVAKARAFRFSRRGLLALSLTLPAMAAEPPELFSDPDTTAVVQKGFISDTESMEIMNRESGIPQTELPKSAPKSSDSVQPPAPELPKAEVKSKATELTRRGGTVSKSASAVGNSPKAAFPKVQTANSSGPDKAAAGKSVATAAPVKPVKSEKNTAASKTSKSEPSSSNKQGAATANAIVAKLEQKSATSAKSAASAKPADKTVASAKTTAKSISEKATANAQKKAASDKSPVGSPAVSHPLRPDPVLARGELTVTMPDGRKAAVRPSHLRSERNPDEGESDDRELVSASPHGPYAVQGKIRNSQPARDGRTRVLVADPVRGLIQVVVPQDCARYDLSSGGYIRIDEDNVGGGAGQVLLESEEFDVPVISRPHPGPFGPSFLPPMVGPGYGPMPGGPVMW